MLDLLELIGGIGELIFSWRLVLCLAAAGLIIAGVYWMIEGEAIRLWLSIPVAVVGIIGGFIWQIRSD
jgi:hypothetical protein